MTDERQPVTAAGRQEVRVFDGPHGSGSHIGWTEAAPPASEDALRVLRTLLDWHDTLEPDKDWVLPPVQVWEQARAVLAASAPLDVERLAEAIANVYIAPSGSRLMDAENVAIEYARLTKEETPDSRAEAAMRRMVERAQESGTYDEYQSTAPHHRREAVRPTDTSEPETEASDADYRHAHIVGKDRCKCGVAWVQGGGWKGYAFHVESVLTAIAIEAEARASTPLDVLTAALHDHAVHHRDVLPCNEACAPDIYARLTEGEQP